MAASSVLVLLLLSAPLPVVAALPSPLPWSTAATQQHQVARICTQVSPIASNATAAPSGSTTTSAAASATSGNVSAPASFNFSTSVVCYRNIFGNWYFTCDAAAEVVRLYGCDNAQCTQNCVLQQNFSYGVVRESRFDGGKTYNWSGVFYTTTEGFISQLYYDSTATSNCSVSAVRFVNHIPASTGACLAWPGVAKASQQFECSARRANGSVITRTDFQKSVNCSNRQELSVATIASTECIALPVMNSFVCGSPALTVSVVVFDRSPSAAVAVVAPAALVALFVVAVCSLVV